MTKMMEKEFPALQNIVECLSDPLIFRIHLIIANNIEITKSQIFEVANPLRLSSDAIDTKIRSMINSWLLVKTTENPEVFKSTDLNQQIKERTENYFEIDSQSHQYIQEAFRIISNRQYMRFIEQIQAHNNINKNEIEDLEHNSQAINFLIDNAIINSNGKQLETTENLTKILLIKQIIFDSIFFGISIDEWNRIGVLLNKDNQYEDAIKCFDIALENNKNHINSIFNKARTLANLNELSEAIKFFKKIEYLYRPDILENIATLYAKMNQFEKALVYFDKVYTKNPHHVETLNNMADMFVKLNKLEPALYFYNRVLKIDPKNPHAMSNKKFIDVETLNNKADMFMEHNKLEPALYFYNRVLKIDPKNPHAMSNKKLIPENIKSKDSTISYGGLKYDKVPRETMEEYSSFSGASTPPGSSLRPAFTGQGIPNLPHIANIMDIQSTEKTLDTMKDNMIKSFDEYVKIEPRFLQSVSDFQLEVIQSSKDVIDKTVAHQKGLIREFVNVSQSKPDETYQQLFNKTSENVDNFVKAIPVGNQSNFYVIDIIREHVNLYNKALDAYTEYIINTFNAWTLFIKKFYNKE